MMGRRSADEWREHALRVLGGVHGDVDAAGALPNAVRDEGQQTEYGEAVQRGCATIVTTADIGQLIPIPDSATLLRSTPESLRRCEREASELLRHIQRDLQVQLQEAGVSYSVTELDVMQQQSNRPTLFAQRRQLAFQSAPVSVAPPPSAEYWRFAATADQFRLYNERFAQRARVMDQLHDNALQRHAAFDDIEQSLREAQETVAMAQANAALILKDSKQPAKRYQLPTNNDQPS